jgi:hypothetical protein
MAVPNPRLIIIDVLNRIRPVQKRNEGCTTMTCARWRDCRDLRRSSASASSCCTTLASQAKLSWGAGMMK